MAGNGNKQLPLTVKQIEDALRKCGGFKSYAAKMLNVTPAAITHRVNRSAHLQKVVKEVEESYLDLSEHTIFKAIKGGNITAAMFHLKCKGKKRGYVERQEITGQDGGPVEYKRIERVIVDPKKE